MDVTGKLLVTVDGIGVRLRLFSTVLSNYYEVRIEADDLIRSVPLLPEEAKQVQSDRKDRIEARLRKAKEARARRAARLAEESRRGKRSGTSRKVKRARELEKEARLRTVQDLVLLEEGLSDRINEALTRSEELHAAVKARLASARQQKRTLRGLAAAIEESQMALGKIAASLENRINGRVRLAADIRSGEIRGSRVPEQIEYVEGQFERVETKLEQVEGELVEARASFARVPDEEPLPEPVLEEEVRAPARAEPRRAPRVAAPVRRESPPEESRVVPSVARVAERPPAEAAPKKSSKKNELPADVAISSLEEESSSSPSGTGGLPIWPLYLIAFACLGIVWRGTRRPAPHPVMNPQRQPPVLR